MISGNETPSDLGATDGDEITCFIDYQYKIDIVGNTKARTVAPFHKPVSPPINKPSTVVNVETDQQYADKEFAKGKYTAALSQVNDHPILKNKFLEKLGGCDQRLANVYFWIAVDCRFSAVITTCLTALFNVPILSKPTSLLFLIL